MRGRALQVSGLLAFAGAVWVSAQQAPTFRASTETVSVFATVQDRTGRLVPDLVRDDFEVLDSGKPVEIAVFSNEIQPITVVVLLDMSGSMGGRLLRVREGSLHFVRALQPDDRARIGTFGSEIAISPILTSEHAVLERVLREELWPGGGTPLWGALGAALDSLEGESGRRVVLTLTDGAAAGTLPGYDTNYRDVRRKVVQGGFMIYAIGLGSMNIRTNFGGTAAAGLDREMVALTEAAGGAHFELRDDADLEATFTRVAEELRRQYLIGFVPRTLDGRTRRLEVRVKGDGYRVRARREYVAGGPR